MVCLNKSNRLQVVNVIMIVTLLLLLLILLLLLFFLICICLNCEIPDESINIGFTLSNNVFQSSLILSSIVSFFKDILHNKLSIALNIFNAFSFVSVFNKCI